MSNPVPAVLRSTVIERAGGRCEYCHEPQISFFPHEVDFLRICEDRGIEVYGRLMALQNGGDVYQRLCQLLRQADDRYNSGLFHFQKEKDRPEPPDDLTLNLASARSTRRIGGSTSQCTSYTG